MLSAAAGYWVLTQASGQKNQVKKLGQILGWAIIVVSVAGAVCKGYLLGTACLTGKPYCPFIGKAGLGSP